MKKIIFSQMLLCISLSFIANSQGAAILGYQIIGERSHKPTLFTQGLLVDQGHFYESSGLYGKSMLVSYPTVEPTTTWAQISAPFVKQHLLAKQYFAEGLALFNNQLFLITWQEGKVFIFDKDTLQLKQELTYSGQGWGLTSDKAHLIRSDGSDMLFVHNPVDFSIIKMIKVKDQSSVINHINELEYVDGYIWANIWYQDRIIKIDLNSGEVIAQCDLSQLRKSLQLSNKESVLNGIAWDAKQQAFWITGKNWPKMFLIAIEDTPKALPQP